MMESEYLNALTERKAFSRNDLLTAMQDSGIKVGDALFKVRLKELLDRGSIVRVGRNAYCIPPEGVTYYSYVYSELSEKAAEMIQANFPYLEFSIFELVQLNEFVNHQIANNIVFISVESDAGQFVFENLTQYFPGKVLVCPNKNIYHQYRTENMLVIERLISEAPKGRNEQAWHARIEKILVDIMADPLVRSSVAASELPAVYEQAFHRYVVDESSLFRYASRRNMKEKILAFIREETEIHLRTRSSERK